MKSLINFLKTTFFGGIIFLIPLLIIVIILRKTINALTRIAEPIWIKWGFDLRMERLVITTAIILVLLLLCFVAGLVVRSTHSSFQIPFANRMAAMLVPGFEIMKAQSQEGLHQDEGDQWQSIFLKMDNSWTLAFVVERTKEGVCSIFIPEIPKMDSGEFIIMTEDQMEAIHIETKEVYGYLKSFGKGAASRFVQERSKK